MPHSYLVRYGMMRHVGRFRADAETVYRRGDAVVVRSRRGTELGEVLVKSEVGADSASSDVLLRAAGLDDFTQAKIAASDRDRRLAECERIFRDGEWPMELIDVEPLLDDRRTVLHYLGPHRLDASGLFQLLRDRCGLDVVLEPVGLDVEDEDEQEPEHADDHGCGSCGTSGGGCGTGCGSGSGGGCSGCAVKDLVGAKRSVATV